MKFFCISDSTKKDLNKFFPSIPLESIFTLYEGYDKKLFLPSCCVSNSAKNSFLLKKYNNGIEINLENPYFIVIGSSSPHKNTEVVLKCLQKIKSEFNLVIISVKGEYGRRIKSLISDYYLTNNVHILNNLKPDELVEFLKNSFSLIYPSTYEGFGLPPIEAMAVGTPVICSHSSSLPEVCGDAAIFFDPKSSESLLEAIAKISDASIREGIIEAGFLNVKRFDWDIIIQDMLEILVQHYPNPA